MTAARRLIITADDFGVSTGVNRAVRELHEAGVLTSAALIPNGEAFADAVDVARATPTLEVGLHFVLARGRPCASPAEVPGLVDGNGMFLDRRDLVARIVRRRVTAREIETEFDAQTAVLAAAGITPSFVNGDQHVHELPVVRDVVVRKVAELGVPMRIPNERIVHEGAGLARRVSSLPRLGIKVANRALAHRLHVRARARNVFTNDRMVSPFGIFPEPRFDAQAFTGLLEHVEPGLTELMVHPSYVDDGVATFWRGKGVPDREAERAALHDPAFRAGLDRHGITLTTYAREWQAAGR